MAVNFDPRKLFGSLEELEKYMAEYAKRTGTVFMTSGSKTIAAANPKRVRRNPALKYMYRKFACECYGEHTPKPDRKKQMK